MKRSLPALLLFCGMAVSSHAALPIVGKGDAMRFDPSGFPQQMKANYETMKEKCTKCHTLERIAVSFATGITPITGRPFDMDVMKATTFSMVRKANAKNIPISKDEAKAISSLLRYLIDESVR